MKKKSSFIGINVTVGNNSITIPDTSAVDFVLCKITTRKEAYPGIRLFSSVYLERCTVSACLSGGLAVYEKEDQL